MKKRRTIIKVLRSLCFLIFILFGNKLNSQKISIVYDTILTDSSKIATTYMSCGLEDEHYQNVNDYYLNGSLKTSYNIKGFTKKFGIVFTYFESGAVKEICNYYSNRKIDEYFAFYENGILKVQGQYQSLKENPNIEIIGDTITIKNEFGEPIEEIEFITTSKKKGIWRYWNENGVLVKEEYYEDGGLIETK